MNTANECKGCRLLREYNSICGRATAKEPKYNYCPCKECLVKIVCSEFCNKRTRDYILLVKRKNHNELI